MVKRERSGRHLRKLTAKTRVVCEQKSHHFVAIVHCDDDLLEVPTGILFRQPTIGHHQLKHVTSRCILHDNGKVVWSEEDLFKGVSTVSEQSFK